MKPVLNCHIVEVGSRYRQVTVFQLTIHPTFFIRQEERKQYLVCESSGMGCVLSSEKHVSFPQNGMAR